ncbi:MAG: hypothetical protein AAB284_01115, partial [Chloroflexota bacterium]
MSSPDTGDELPRSDLAWLADEIVCALVHPHAFARSLGGTHFGLGSVLVAFASGASLSIGLDLLVVAAHGADPLSFGARLLTAAFLLGGRVAVVCALLALVPVGLWVAAVHDRRGAAAVREFVRVNNMMRFTGGAAKGHDNP